MRKFFVLIPTAMLALAMTFVSVAHADTTPQRLPLSQDFTDINLITSDHDWSRVPGIIGYRGDNLAAEGSDPQTVTADGSGTPVVVFANNTQPSAFNKGGVAEFHRTNQTPPNDTNPTVAFQGNVTADAPHLVLSLDTTGQSNVLVAYTLRDIDGGANDSITPVALQYRVGNSGPYTNVPAGYVADATTGPNLAVKNTPVSAVLPADANDKPLVQVRIITVDSVTQDEWIGVDYIVAASSNPSIDLNGGGTGTDYSATFTEDGGSVAIVDNAALTVNDADSTTLSSATATITNLQDATAESLSADTAGTPITAGYNSSTGVLTLSGAGTPAQYQQVLRTVRYNNTSENPNTTARTVNFVVSDGTYGSTSATSTVTVNRVNDAPVNTVPSGQITAEDTARVFSTANNNRISISDVDAGGSVVAVTLSATNGTLTLSGTTGLTFSSGNGVNDRTMSFTGTTININDALNGLRFDPDQDYNGSASLNITTSDQGNTGSGGAQSDADQVEITVTPVNDAPVADDDTATTDEDTAVVIDVKDGDAPGPADESAQSLAITNVVTAPANGTAEIIATGPDAGKVRYTPNPDYSGSESFEYRVCDDGRTNDADDPKCDTGAVSITVDPVNDAPVANGDNATLDEDGSTRVDVLENDADADDNGTLDPGSVGIVSAPQNGTATVNDDGTITYRPNADFNGNDTFTYEVCDEADPAACDTATVSVAVSAVNDAPVARDDQVSTPEDTPITIPQSELLQNDGTGAANEDQTLSVTDVSNPVHGTVELREDNNIVFTPEANYNGDEARFDYTITDGQGNQSTATATVKVRVDAVNDLPVANDDSATVAEDTTLSIPVSELTDNDSPGPANEASQTLTITGVGNAQNGTVRLEGDRVVFEPTPNYDGPASFTYTITDGHGGTDTARVSVTVSAVNDTPDANDDAAETDEDEAVTVNVIANVIDPDGIGDLDLASVQVVNGPQNGWATANGDGSITYTPNANFNGTDALTYRLCDLRGQCDTAAVEITVNPVNDAPVARNDQQTVPEDTELRIRQADLLANDAAGPANESGQSLRITEVSDPTNGTVGLADNGDVVFTPAPGYNGPASFVYTVTDGAGITDTATANVNVTVSPVNDEPAGQLDQVTTPEDQTITIDVLANDTDPENDGLSIVEGSLTQPQNGAVEVVDGRVRYTPRANFNGTDTFDYRASDGNGGISAPVRVTVTVTSVNDAPDAVGDTAATLENTAKEIDVLSDDTDIENDTLRITRFAQPANGTVDCVPEGVCTYTPNANFTGTETFTYEVCDAQGACDAATVTVNVAPSAGTLVVRDDLGSTAEAAAVSNSFISQYAAKASKPTRLSRLDTARRPYGLVQIGANIAPHINAIGYRSTDNSLYGYRLTGRLGIMQIDPATGAARFLGIPAGLPAKSYIAGDVSPDGSTYYLYANKSGVLRAVNLTTFRATSVKLSSMINVADLAVSPTDGNLYGVASDGRLLQVDPETGQVTARSVAGLNPGTYGATWFTATGDLIAYENGRSRASGTMTWIAHPTTAPKVVSTQAGPSTAGNDGAAYVAPPNPAGLSVVVNVLANDGGPDGALNRNTLRIVQPPANGTVSVDADKTITYTSNSSYRGTDSFRYEVCDNGAPRQCGTATVNITSAPITSSAASRNE